MTAFTDDFRHRHVIDLPADGDDPALIDIVRLAESTWSVTPLDPGSHGLGAVMFLRASDLRSVIETITDVAADQPFTHTGRIPWIVTWRGPLGYDVIRNAAGFHGLTDSDGRCAHYRGPVHGTGSEHTTWMETAVYYRRR